MGNGYNVIPNDPYGPPDSPDSLNIYAPQEWGPHPEDLAPSPLKLAIEDFGREYEIDYLVIVDLINWTLRTAKAGESLAVGLSEAIREYKRSIAEWKARKLWALMPKFIIDSYADNIGMQPALKLEQGAY